MDLRDTLSIRLLGLRETRALTDHKERARRLFAAMLSDDPNGLALAERPLADLPAAGRLAAATSEEVISIAIASAGYLRKIPLDDKFRSLSLKTPRAYRIHFAAIRILEVSSEAGLPFDLGDTKLLCSIALNASHFEGTSKVSIQRSSDWPDFAAELITNRVLAQERLDLFDPAVSAAEVLDGGLYDGPLASRIVRLDQRLRRVKSPSYEVGEMRARIQRVLHKPTSLLGVNLP